MLAIADSGGPVDLSLDDSAPPASSRSEVLGWRHGASQSGSRILVAGRCVSHLGPSTGHSGFCRPAGRNPTDDFRGHGRLGLRSVPVRQAIQSVVLGPLRACLLRTGGGPFRNGLPSEVSNQWVGLRLLLFQGRGRWFDSVFQSTLPLHCSIRG